jgi:hypothetical protein
LDEVKVAPMGPPSGIFLYLDMGYKKEENGTE